MYITLNDARIYVATGGKAFDSNLPTVVFLHGSGLDHRTWALQTRWFAFHGFSVLAPDFPGHSLSAGQPLASIETMADWLWQLLDQLEVQQCSLIGHSQGGLVALEAASQQHGRIRSVSLLGTAAAIPVNEQLLMLAESNRPAAVDAMLSWGFGEAYQFGRSHVPGQAPIGIGWQIMCDNPLHTDLLACQSYSNGERAAQNIQAPAQLILAQRDRMTPAKAGRALAEQLPNVVRLTELEKVGHMLPIEAPEQCLTELKQFITGLEKGGK
ncbi:MAG: alpha/beta hydrolase [Thiolinea sp.]